MKVLDAIKKLNGLKNEDDELLIETIDLKELKGAKEKDLAEAFMTAIESLSEEDSDKYIPEELAELYNKLAGTEEEPSDPVTKKEPKEKEVKKEEKKAPSDKKADKKAPAKEVKKEDKKVPAKKEPKKTGWKEGSKCDQLHQLVIGAGAKGILFKDVVTKSVKFGVSESYAKAILAECVRRNLAKKDGEKFTVIK